MDGDHVELVALDVVGQDLQRLPLRVVALLAPVDHPEVVRAEVRGDRRGDRVPVLSAYDQDDAVHALDVEHRAHRACEHRDPVEGEQHLVGLGSDPRARAGGEDDGGGAGVVIRAAGSGG